MATQPKPILTFAELQVIREEFAKADLNKDNTLSLQEFQALLGSTLNSIDLFGLFDKNSDGKISFDEFLTALAVLTKGTTTQKLEFLFDYYDKDNNGMLTSNEILILLKHVKEGVKALLGPGKEQQAEVDAEAIVKNLDVNKDGKITRAEWLSGNDHNLLLIFGLENLLG